MHSEKNPPLTLVSCVILLSVILSSCSTGIFQTYSGSRLPPSKVACISSTASIRAITQIDSQEVNLSPGFWSLSGPSDLELLPGEHTLTVLLIDQLTIKIWTTIRLRVAANHSYELDRWGNNVVLIDKQDGSFVAPSADPDDVVVRSQEPTLAKSSEVRLLSIDGENFYSILPRFAIRLVPGLHTFIFSYSDIALFKTDVEGSQMTVSVNLEAGCTYMVEPQVDLTKMTWLPKLVRTNR
jgi:hypothetical protein